jgi:hypothetical protein
MSPFSHSGAVVSYLTQMAPFIAVAALVLAAVAVILLIVVSRRLEGIGLGEHGELEATISRLSKEIKELQAFRTELEAYLKLAEVRLRSTVRGVGVVRFNAFANSAIGGNQSFAVAFLDEKQNGVVFSTLYSRDRVGVYAKPIENGVSTFSLTPEEEESLKKATASLATRARKK